MEQPFSNEEMAMQELRQQFLALSDSPEVAGRLIFLGPDGAVVGQASLSANDIETATDALTSVNAYRAAEEEDLLDPGAQCTTVDPQLVASLEEQCIGLDAEFLMEKAMQDPTSAVAAFDEITSGPRADGDDAR